MEKGTLYLIPVPLGGDNIDKVLSTFVPKIVQQIDYYIVENSKTARKYIKLINPEKKQSELKLFELNKHTPPSEIRTFIKPLLEGKDMGLMSDAGCPAIADPGAIIVGMAHELGIKVVPMVGASSIILALMGSGMNGQSFSFNGYLPIDKAEKKNKIKLLEKISYEHNQSQIFIETPFRNNQLLDDLLNILHPNTLVCVACDITLETEFIQTHTVQYWKKNKPDLHKRPTVFVVHKK